MSDQKMDRRTALFVASQAAFWPVAGFAAIKTRWDSDQSASQLPALRNQPLSIRPLHDLEPVCTDAQLLRVLTKLRLKRTAAPPKVNHVDHSLRMWGHEVTFADKSLMGGPEMLSMLIDDRTLRAKWGDNVRPLLVETPDGVRVRTQEGSATSSHVDHTLATLTEIGLPLSTKIRTRHGQFAVEDLLQRALRSFSLNQQEYEWTALALGLYAEDSTVFCTSEGQQVDLDFIAQRMMRESLGHGVCYGGHRLFTLAMLKRIDVNDRRIFSESTRQAIREHLSIATQRLYGTQSAQGHWDAAWPGYKPPSSKALWEQGARLVATGHALEWWAMIDDAPLLPPRETIIRAGQWLVREIEAMDQATVQKNFTFLTHAGRALSMWRGELPADSWRRLAPNELDADDRDTRDRDVAGDTQPKTLWQDQRGFMLSIEFILFGAITIIGALVGFAVYRDALVQEIGDSAAGVAALSQTFEFEGESQSGTFGVGVSAITYDARTQGSAFVDTTDLGEAVLDASGSAPLCIQIDATSVGDE